MTEVLLAVMIVGIIGVALASLTTAASRESSVGRSKVLLRNNLSIALRQLRRDVHEATRVLYVRGRMDSSSADDVTPLLVLAKNVNRSGGVISSSRGASYVMYCFVTGGNEALPSGALAGGKIYRGEFSNEPSWNDAQPDCGTPDSDSAFTVFLNNVKFIPPIGSSGDAGYYPVPLVQVFDYADVYSEKDSSTVSTRRKDLASVLQVKLITELSSTPVVNDVVDEIFVLRNGFRARGS